MYLDVFLILYLSLSSLTCHYNTFFSLCTALKPPYKLFFRVKFYAVDPSALHEEITR